MRQQQGTSFFSELRLAIARTDDRFLVAGQLLLEQKSFEDMVFSSTGFCENGDFFYHTTADTGPTAREKLAAYLELKDTFDQFTESVLLQMRSHIPEDPEAFKNWLDEELRDFERRLSVLSC